MDGQLALPARVALLESLLSLTLAGCPPAHPAALRFPPVEEVRQAFTVGTVIRDELEYIKG